MTQKSVAIVKRAATRITGWIRSRVGLRTSLALILALQLLSSPARADEGREFMAACTYGLFAGTLVGAASLAFTEQPGNNLNRVARGASLGFYAGILLGLYAIYLVPDAPDPDSPDLYQKPGRGDINKKSLFNVAVLPTLNQHNRPDGATAQFHLLTF